MRTYTVAFIDDRDDVVVPEDRITFNPFSGQPVHITYDDGSELLVPWSAIKHLHISPDGQGETGGGENE